MTTNKHISTDLTTANTKEAQKAQEWVRSNQSVKIGSKTVAGILSEVRTLISGTLNLAEKPGKLSNTQTDAIIAKIQEDAFAKKYIEKQLDHENNRTKRNVLEALDMYYEVRAYLGLVSYMSSTLESHGKKCEKAKTAFAAGDTSSIPQKHNGDFQEWKKELEKEKTKLETSFSMLPKVGQDRLNANYTQWLTESDLSSITGLPPAPTHTPPTNPNIFSNRNIAITTLPHSEKIQGGINAGETLWITNDGTTWSPVPVDASNNFDIPVSETANGSYTYRLKTKNAAGVDSGEETVIVDINVVAPAVAPTQPNITSGTSFSVNTPTIEGNTTPGSEVEIYEGANKIGDGIADASGIFSITTSPLADGTHGIKVEAFNPADRSKKDHKNHSIVIDTAPTEPTLTHTDYTIDPPEIEGRTTPNVDVELTVNGTTYPGRTNASGIFKIRPTAALGNGTHRIQVIAKNGASTSSTLIEDIIVRKALTAADLRSFTISSLEIEQGETKPSLKFNNLKEGTKITIFDKTGRNQISDEFEVPAGITTEDIELFMSTEYPGEQGIVIKIEDVHGGQPAYFDRGKKVKITPRKIIYSGNVTGSITSKMDRDGKIPFGSQVTASINNIPKGAKLRVVGPVHRLRGASEIELGHWGNDNTKFAGVVDIDTKVGPFDAEEELKIEIYDPSRPGDAGLIKEVTPPIKFKVAKEEAVLNQTTIQAPAGKIKNGTDAIFRIARPNNDTEIVVEPGGTTFDVVSLTPPEIRISGITTAGKHSYTFYIQDKNHRGKPRELMGTYEIEIDHPELTLTPPVVPVTPIRCTQGGTKPSVTLSGLVPGSEVVLTGPNGELTKFIVSTTSKTIALTRLDISQADIQDINVQVSDPHHANITPEMNTFQINVEKKKEAPKHLPQPVFKTPVDYAEGSGDIEVELLNAVTHSEVTVEYDTAGGRTTTTPLTVAADGNLKLPLAGFDAPSGTTNITVNYRNPVSGAIQSRTITMHVADRPAIERPEGLQDETDINTKPFDVKIGKIKPGQTITIAGDTQMSDGTTAPGTLRNNGGTHVLNIPAGAESIKQNYTITVTDSAGRSESFPIVVNVKVPPKANERINHHNFEHACEHAKDHGHGTFLINGATPPHHTIHYSGRLRKFYRGFTYPQYWTVVHGERFSSSDPNKLYTMVKEHLDHHNQHEKDEYNAYWGLMPESSDHKKDGEHGKDHGEKDGKKDKEGGHEKGGHGDHGSESKGGGFTGALKTVVTAPFKALWKQPAWLLGAEAGLGWSLASGGAVLLGPAVLGCAGLGATAWALKKLWQIKNGKKGDESGGHGGH